MALSVTVESASLQCFRSHSFIANLLYKVRAERRIKAM